VVNFYSAGDVTRDRRIGSRHSVTEILSPSADVTFFDATEEKILRKYYACKDYVRTYIHTCKDEGETDGSTSSRDDLRR
jgi:hypothetical protein